MSHRMPPTPRTRTITGSRSGVLPAGRRPRGGLALAALALLAGCAATPAGTPAATPPGAPGVAPGPVLAVGGGGTPAEALRLGLGHAPAGARVAVVPFASGREDRGVGAVEMWLEAGAGSAALVPEDAGARRLLEEADVIWLGGGSQHRLMDSLEALDLVDLIRARHRGGALVGGTSAGAAVLGSVLISGSPDPRAYVGGAMPTRPALDLVPGVLVDQHFRERNREGRLLTAVLDGEGAWVGVGISERTAALFEGAAFEVAGEGVVIVVDARRARIAPAQPGAPRTGSGVLLSVHAPGERRSLGP